MPHIKLGESIPPDTAHVSPFLECPLCVSLPTWRSNVAYEEGESWVLDSMVTGYPRFYIHKSIAALAQVIAQDFGQPGQKAMLFPSRTAAQRCQAFIKAKAPASAQDNLGSVHLVLDSSNPAATPLRPIHPTVSAVLFLPEAFSYAKQYWQHSGDGISSRRAEFCHGLLAQGLLVPAGSPKAAPVRQLPPCKGPRRYQKPMSVDDLASTAPARNSQQPDASGPDSEESSRFVEERFGRNLDISLVERAKTAIRRRIAGTLTSDVDVGEEPLPQAEPSNRGVQGLTEHDIYIYPMGMNAIFNTHRLLLSARGSMKSVEFGFPYVDTLKILQKFGPGCVFYGHASEEDLDDLEQRLRSGERFLCLFCEFPGNPVLTCPNLRRIRALADEYDFAVVVDETIGTFANINVLQYADVVVSSLTKIFSGDCNVMGGAAVLNPKSRYYAMLKEAAAHEYEDTYWAEDAIFLERNSRDFATRIDRINTNAEAICEVLLSNPMVKRVHYPKHNEESRAHYDACKVPGGGYGGLLSVVFHRKADAMVFYDNIATAKGPSLGTNFTITSPYVVLAHYAELDWVASLGVDPDLLRISVGLEETDELVSVFKSALLAAEQASEKSGP
ncbi:PLP-dependent transferase [Cryphonectria parasitica EP155]|uniref:cystathionine gamma-synthase n=1 Tax=Cryphonectria parasitica (strain ATCC 38755 / EP155) TaxID=660469 RepID=A0A9P5CLW0_CRYP1|nr:PLP-dependent transferase [Cryphonectria parasitica EP155]KAF3763729.1 PLP-dependent transferase [Cryphonectria parasitica EP155]